MADQVAPPDGEKYWVFLIDPAWQGGDDEQPPNEAVVGCWLTSTDGTSGRFIANPEYVPSSPHSPTDPVDATVRLVAKGKADAERLLETLREAELAVAVDEEQRLVIAPAPDEVPSVLVITAPFHEQWVEGVSWQALTAAELAEAMPAEGVDVLINPGSVNSMRLLASALRRAVA